MPAQALWLHRGGAAGAGTLARPLRLPPSSGISYPSRGLLHMGVIMGSFGDMAREGSRAQDLGQFGGSETRAAPWLH